MERGELTGCRCGMCRLPVVSGRCGASSFCSRSESLSAPEPLIRLDFVDHGRRPLKAHSNSLFRPDAGRFQLGAILLANYAPRGLAVSNARRLHDLSQSHPSTTSTLDTFHGWQRPSLPRTNMRSSNWGNKTRSVHAVGHANGHATDMPSSIVSSRGRDSKLCRRACSGCLDHDAQVTAKAEMACILH